jgi:hypothetical protein
MFGFGIVLAALAFTGAPSTPVVCNPELPAQIQGVTDWNDTSQPASLIELAPSTCAGILLLSASPAELQKIVALNGPSLNVAMLEGIGTETILMEAEHTTHPFSGHDETDDLCRATAALPSFLSRYLSGDALAAALRWASIYTASQNPAVYHTHPC